MSIGLPKNIRKIEDIISDNPSLKDYAKLFNQNRFSELGFVILSQPQTHPEVTMYGLWLVDKHNVRDNKINISNKNEIVQDFIAYDRKSKKYIYYSGGAIKYPEQQGRIYQFCQEFGKNKSGTYKYYGCLPNGRITTNHRYRDENDPELPSEQWIRQEIRNRLEKIRAVF